MSPRHRKRSPEELERSEAQRAVSAALGCPGGMTLCWRCANTAYGLCSWFTDFTPVEGWDATPTMIYSQRHFKFGAGSFLVHACPNFEPESDKSCRERRDEYLRKLEQK